ncbi:hypothetical protein WIW50_19245 [Flavobacteriaceae bacterium 3-367]
MKQFLLSLIVLLGMACKSSKERAQNTAGQEVESDSLTLVFQDDYSGISAPQFMVIKGAKELQGLFSKINRTRKPGIPVPEVDFAKDLLVVYCSGETSTNTSTSLRTGKETGDTVLVELVEQVDPEAASITVVTTPICIYKMPLTPKTVTLNER